MLKAKGSAKALFIAVMMASLTIGCSDASTQRWNEFWGVDGKSRRRPVRSSPGGAQQAANAGDRNGAGRDNAAESVSAGKTSEEPVANGAGASEAGGDVVDRDVDAYVSSMNPPPKSDYEPNDHMSKIHRQQDPNRHKRIETAARQDASAGGDVEPANDSALSRYEKNTGVQVAEAPEAKPAEPQREEPSVAATADPAPAEEKPVVRTAAKREEPAKRQTPPVQNAAAEPMAGEPVGVQANAAPRRIVDEPEPTNNGTESSGKLPELDEISVTAGPKPDPAEPADSSNNATVSANTPSEAITQASLADSFQDRIEAQEAIVARDPNNLEEQYRLRMMYLVDGQDDKAKAVIPGVDADIQDIMSAQIDSLISARSTSGRDPATWATRQLESLEELRRLVKQRADLVVPKVVLCTEVENYGRYKPIEPAEFKAGRSHRVLIYIEVDNFTSKTTNSGMYRTLLTVRQTLMTKEGKVVWSDKTENIEDIARRPRRDFFLTMGPITIPKSLPPGEYLLKFEVEDMFAAKMNSGVAKMRIMDNAAPALAGERLPE